VLRRQLQKFNQARLRKEEEEKKMMMKKKE